MVSNRTSARVLFCLLVSSFLFVFPSAAQPPFELSRQASSGGAQVFQVLPQGPGWLALPPLKLHVEGPTQGASVRLRVAREPGAPWQDVPLTGETGTLPFSVKTVADLWNLQLSVEPAEGTSVTIEPSVPLAVEVIRPDSGVEEPGLKVANWGPGSRLEIKAVDAAGRALPLESVSGPISCSRGHWYDLGFVQSAFQTEVRVQAGAAPSYPLVFRVRSEAGYQTERTLYSARQEAAGVPNSYVYYGFTKENYNCNGQATNPANGQDYYTSLIVAAIGLGTTSYTLNDLTNPSAPGYPVTGTLDQGAMTTLSSLPDNSQFSLVTSQPVQAMMGFNDCGSYWGTTFFMSDDGLTKVGKRFTVPIVGTASPIQYWIVATGAGTVTVAGTGYSSSYTFTGAGAQQVTGLTAGNVYTFSGPVNFLVEQSSQNAASEVPPELQSVTPGTCGVTTTGLTFLFQLQGYSQYNNGYPAIAVFGYDSGAGGSFTLTNLAKNGKSVTQTFTSHSTTFVNFTNLHGNQSMPTTGVFQLTSTAPVTLLIGSFEGGTNIGDMGDDEVIYQGTGTQIVGHGLNCGGNALVAQDGTQVTLNGGTPTTLNAGQSLAIPGGASFVLTTQDAQHPVLAAVFGGNCATKLNDWAKVMQPMALSAPVITYPTSGSYLLSTTPNVVGVALPNATVTLFVTPSGGSQPIFTGMATADATGHWSIQVTTVLQTDLPYDFDAAQSLTGVCAATPDPPPGSSGTSGSVTVTPPTVTAPADGSSSYNQTPDFTGTAPAGTTVTVYIDGAAAGTATVDVSGTWSYTPSSPLAYSSHTVYAIAQDGADNTSVNSNTNTFTILALPALLRFQWTGTQSSGALAPPNPATVFPNDTLPIPPNAPSDPALAPVAPYPLANFQSGTFFPNESYDAKDTTPQVVFYQLQGDTTDILKVAKVVDANGQPIVVITYAPP